MHNDFDFLPDLLPDAPRRRGGWVRWATLVALVLTLCGLLSFVKALLSIH